MYSSPTLRSFNSNMVRLKEAERLNRISMQKFQFQYGSIKRIRLRERRIIIYSFNSNMVRLKEEWK